MNEKQELFQVIIDDENNVAIKIDGVVYDLHDLNGNKIKCCDSKDINISNED